MKRLALVGLIALAWTLPSRAEASSITTGDQIKVLRSSGSLGGGPWEIDGPDPDSLMDFVTFCLERNEGVGAGNTYFVKLEMYASDGGNGGQNQPSDPSPSPKRDYLSERTAYLYSQFLDGLLPGYTGNEAQRNGIQLAIWYFENEVGTNNGPNPVTFKIGGPAAHTYANILITYANTYAQAGNFYGIQVMQLWRNYDSQTGTFSGNAQDFLIRTTPVPEGLTTLTALLLGVTLVVYGRGRAS